MAVEEEEPITTPSSPILPVLPVELADSDARVAPVGRVAISVAVAEAPEAERPGRRPLAITKTRPAVREQKVFRSRRSAQRSTAQVAVAAPGMEARMPKEVRTPEEGAFGTQHRPPATPIPVVVAVVEVVPVTAVETVVRVS